MNWFLALSAQVNTSSARQEQKFHGVSQTTFEVQQIVSFALFPALIIIINFLLSSFLVFFLNMLNCKRSMVVAAF